MLEFITKKLSKPNESKDENKPSNEAKIWGFSRIFTYKNMTILDVDCDDGFNLKNIAYSLKDAKIVGSDSFAKRVKIAEENNDLAIKNGRMNIVKSPASKLPFKDNSFDLITAFNGIISWNNLEKNLKEMKRLLKKGGKFYILLQNEDETLKSDDILNLIHDTDFIGRGKIAHENKLWSLIFATK